MDNKKLNKLIADDNKHTNHLDKRMSRMMHDHSYDVIDVDKQVQQSMTFGQKVADRVAKFGGSWTFLISFIVILVGWITVNSLHLFGANFDPFPFILLNLFLSMVSALQAPLIMMSQNRASDYDRMNSKNDYHINLKSEEEIRILHSKLDHLIHEDQPNNIKIQKMQMQMLDEISKQLAELKKNK
ncbi:Uncharacterized membrane protein [Fructobacillus evanidus]|uniref:Uncharacterized membrane protein n=1 Tax=Fructobacillus evanidus TaxID=3064281 RepID=A0ABM9MZL7_9LACO|nr:Uncharacterized membrane protein [Fructobacillus sp. LMG 32999]CAK1251291.1 Uncharacterized membrane protein [Fructobacillus sp. LMG 32999]